MTSFESVSTWKQVTPGQASPERAKAINSLAAEVCALSPGRLRVAIDGLTAAGKTSFGHELAASIRRLGRSTLRTSFDDFKKPWRDAKEKGYDRTSGEGYYRNAPDFESARELLLEPAGPGGSGVVALALRRGIERDAEMEGEAEAEPLHRDRYHAAEMIYMAEVSPELVADVVIDNTNFAAPQVTRPA